jgi:hypothetical protein
MAGTASPVTVRRRLLPRQGAGIGPAQSVRGITLPADGVPAGRSSLWTFALLARNPLPFAVSSRWISTHAAVRRRAVPRAGHRLPVARRTISVFPPFR